MDFGLKILDFRFWIFSEFEFKILNFGSLISDFRFWISEFGFQISDFEFQISDFGRFQISDLVLQIFIKDF